MYMLCKLYIYIYIYHRISNESIYDLVDLPRIRATRCNFDIRATLSDEQSRRVTVGLTGKAHRGVRKFARARGLFVKDRRGVTKGTTRRRK